jgi:hypothetical protein
MQSGAFQNGLMTSPVILMTYRRPFWQETIAQLPLR